LLAVYFVLRPSLTSPFFTVLSPLPQKSKQGSVPVQVSRPTRYLSKSTLRESQLKVSRENESKVKLIAKQISRDRICARIFCAVAVDILTVHLVLSLSLVYYKHELQVKYKSRMQPLSSIYLLTPCSYVYRRTAS